MTKKSIIFVIFIGFIFSMHVIAEEIDLLEKAAQARWSNTENKIINFGKDQGSDGTVKYEHNIILEDGKKYNKVLFIHPQWRKNGTVLGTFDNITIPENDPKIIIAGGFNQGASGTDGVSFNVSFNETREQYNRNKTRVQKGTQNASYLRALCSFNASYDRKIDRKECSLAAVAGKKGNLTIMVEAGNSPDKDWAVWTEIKITSRTAVKAKPDKKEKQIIKILKGHGSRIYRAVFSPNGKYLVTASGDKTARVWEVASGKLVTVLRGHDSHIFSASFSPNSKRIITASRDKTARIWQASNGKQLQELRGHSKEVLSAAFSPQGNLIATGSNDGTIKIWQGSSEVRTIKVGNNIGINAVVFSPNGRNLAIGGTNGILTLYNPGNGRSIRAFPGHKRAVYTVLFSRNGKRLVSASLDNTAKVWNVSNGRQVQSFSGRAFYSADFSPNGEFVVTGNDGMALVWRVNNGKKAMTLKHPSGSVVRTVSFSPNGKFVAMGGDDSTACIWKVELNNQAK